MGKRKSKVGKQKQTKARQRQNGGKASLLGGATTFKVLSSQFRPSKQHQQQQPHSVTASIGHHPLGDGGQPSSPHPKNNAVISNLSAAAAASLSTPTSNIQGGSIATMDLNRQELIHRLQSNRQPKVFLSPLPARTPPSDNLALSLQPRLRSRTDDGERVDFEQDMASLRERQWAAAYANSGSINNSKKKKKRGKSSSSTLHLGGGSGNAHSPSANASSSPFAFAPPSFSVDKSTQDLLQETMHQMVHMTGVGISAVEKTPIRSNKTVARVGDFAQDVEEGEADAEGHSFEYQQLPPTIMMTSASSASSSSSSSANQQNYQQYHLKPSETNRSSSNPFAALGTGDSDDEGDGNNGNGWTAMSTSSHPLSIRPPQSQLPSSMLSFAPPSFSLVPTLTPTPVSTPTAPGGHNPLKMKYGNAGSDATTCIGISASSLSMALQFSSRQQQLQEQQQLEQQQPSTFGSNDGDDDIDPDL